MNLNLQAIRILVMKDLFLSRKYLFGYFAGGMVSSVLACVPNSTVSFIGFILMLTVAIASGIHLIGLLLLAESTDHTRLFIMSLPVSLLDYSIGKISVVLTTYLIPWSAMLVLTTILAFVLPWSRPSSAILLPVIFLFLFSTFMIQLVVAVVSESVGWTISIMVGCNVAMNVFLMKLYGDSNIAAALKSDAIVWPPILSQIMVVECLIIVAAFAVALLFQTRKRDLI